MNQDTSPDGLVILDAVRDDSGNIVDFVCEYANAAGAYMLRRSVDDLFGHQLLEIIPDSLEFEEYVRALETRQSMDSEIYDSTEGAERWFKRTAVPLTELLLVTYRDITAHKRQERRRRFVVEAASQLSESADTEEILRRLTTVAVLDFADCALAYLINGLGQVRRIGTAHADNSRRHALLEFDRQLPQALRSDIVHSTIRRANVVIQQDIDEQAIADWSRDPGLAAVLRQLAPRSGLAAPIVGRQRAHAVLVLAAVQRGRMPFDAVDLESVRTIAHLAGFVMDGNLIPVRRGARSDPEQDAGDERALLQATAAILAASSVESMIQEIPQSATMAVGADSAVVERIQGVRESIRIAASTGANKVPVGSVLQYSGTLVAHLMECGQPQLIPRLSDTELSVSPELIEAYGDWAVLAVPLADPGEAIGSLLLLRSPGQPLFEEDEIGRAGLFANLASVAFRRVHLLEEAQRLSGAAAAYRTAARTAHSRVQ